MLLTNTLNKLADKNHVPDMKKCRTAAEVLEYARRTKSRGAYITAIIFLSALRAHFLFDSSIKTNVIKEFGKVIDNLKSDFYKHYPDAKENL